MGPLGALAASPDGLWLASCGDDGSCNLFDVVNFDMVQMWRLPAPAVAAAWLARPGHPPVLVCADASGTMHVIDRIQRPDTPIRSLQVHRAYVTSLSYVPSFHCLLSTDCKGLVELWEPTDTAWAIPKSVSWSTKSQTDLYALCKAKTWAVAAAVSPEGDRFALACADDVLRIFRVATGKMASAYDESPDKQTPPAGAELADAGRRTAFHRQMLSETAEDTRNGTRRRHLVQPVWDRSGHLLLYPSMWGVKVINTDDHRLLRLIGSGESERFINLALFQDQIGANLDLGEAQQVATEDPTLFATALSNNCVRFFLFTQRPPPPPSDDPTAPSRDVINERPVVDETAAPARVVKLPDVCVLHTTLGDIRLRLFPRLTPKTYDNFVGLVNKGYYDGLVFHRVIRGFMIQTGDPAGDGTGGESLWGGEFEDEFHPELRHDRPGVLSMANTGTANTNASQFFITTVPISRLDGKHTVFGRVEKGLDVVMAIEKVDTDKDDRPREPCPRIVSANMIE